MTELEQLIETLSEKYADREDDAEKLDELVIEAACNTASAVNNGGISSQIEYLLLDGYNEKDIKEALDG